MTTETINRQLVAEKKLYRETPQIYIRFFGFFIDQALEILKLQQRYSNDWPFDIDPENISRIINILNSLTSQIASIRDKDPNIEQENSDKIIGRFVRRFKISPNATGIEIILDGIIRTTIVLTSIVREAKKNDIDPNWLLEKIEGYLLDKTETLELMKEALDYIPPRIYDFPKEDRSYVLAISWLYHIEDRKKSWKDARFACKMVPKWVKFLARSPLFKYDQ